jgi:hypothetical protein
MATQANVTAILDEEVRDDGSVAVLAIELDAIPGAVWQMELTSLLPGDIRVSLFEQGARKCALLTYPQGERERALAAFEQARQAANQVSRDSHAAARAASERPRQA